MKTAALFCLAILAALPVTVLTQSPPTDSEGIQLARVNDIRFPLTVAQCEPVLIYYNVNTTGGSHLFLHSASSELLAHLAIPVGVGYLEWVCNIPAGHGFRVSAYYEQYFVVQAGSSSSCLRALTTTYSYVNYATTAFQSYTSNAPSTVTSSISAFPAKYV